MNNLQLLPGMAKVGMIGFKIHNIKSGLKKNLEVMPFASHGKTICSLKGVFGAVCISEK